MDLAKKTDVRQFNMLPRSSYVQSFGVEPTRPTMNENT